MNEENNINNKLLMTMQIINIFIGIIISLISIIAYITIKSIYIRSIIIIIIVGIGLWCFISVYKRINKKEILKDYSNINTIQLVNEDNEIIRNWDIGERISFIIGKNGTSEDMLIDLNFSIYSDSIENNHAVLNYAVGKWYIEDLSEEVGISIQKFNDNKRYRIVKDSPCELMKGDILFISKIKLLLK